jgi:RES domain-containing protein
MATFWRISNHADLSGRGGRLSSGRWHTPSRPIVYLSDSPAGSMLERLVHLQDGSGKLPQFYDLLQIFAPDEIPTRDLLPLAHMDWKKDTSSTQRLGNAWLESLETALARVPSALVPRSWNYLLNPAHPEAQLVVIQEVIRERFDNRLFVFNDR